jgi:GntR family transcriptional regulator, rspAB operon transcriptional repressor
MARPQEAPQGIGVASGGGDSTSMVDGAYATLLSAIVDRRMGAGTPLSQNRLASHLGVSRTPVREALLRLERDGLVTRTSDNGFIVATITPDEVNEACDLLELLDTYVYLRAAETLDREQLDELRELADVLVESVESGDTAAWRTADQRYHQIIAEAANNRFVAEAIQQVRRRVQRFWLQEPHFDGRLRHCAQDHIAFTQAMAERDEAGLKKMVAAHTERMRRSVLQSLASVAPLLPAHDPLEAVRS